MKALWRRDQFLKAPRFKDPWKDNKGRKYMFVRADTSKWAITKSDQWDDGDAIAHVRVGSDAELPNEDDTIIVKKGDSEFKFLVKRVFREVGRRKSKPIQIQPL